MESLTSRSIFSKNGKPEHRTVGCYQLGYRGQRLYIDFTYTYSIVIHVFVNLAHHGNGDAG